MIHQTFGVAPGGQIKCHGVEPADLEEYMAHAIKRHPDWALIVDGVCKHKGKLDKYQIGAAHIRIMQLPHLSKITKVKQGGA